MAGGFPRGGRGEIKSAINVTPLVDVVLVLLIIFMLVTPMLTRGKEVHLPVATAVDQREQPDALTVTMTADKNLWIENQAVPGEALTDEIAKRLAQDARQDVLLKADDSVSVGDVRPVLVRLRRAGVKRFAFGVAERKRDSR
jgi:biopolymer transport protein ExbD